ncbi:MAG: APC family permease, partial [Solirubrobacterales bacterium]|nr:APC family permease [Solirubrobacterales bacterium]
MARRLLPGLERVLGVNALFATAYGNVGSSIYYALGLVASYALGLTPVVFVISGILFYLTAATYSEATSMYPEAGGSSSFARHAFNEFWSFFAAWGQMLNYTITIAISAFFVPHYIGGLFWEPLRHSPGDIIAAIGVIVLLSIVNVRGVEEAAGVNIFLAVIDFATQLLLVLAGLFLVFSPDVLIHNVNLGVAPTWTNFVIAIPVGMIAYTGIETISNMAEEARSPGKTVPKAINRVVIAVFAIYAVLPAVALSALPVTCVDGKCQTQLGIPSEQGGFAGDPVLGVVKHLSLGALQGPAEIYVGILAATILFIATNAGIIGVSRLVYSMGLHRQVPDRLRELHPKYRTPWIGILLFGAIACVAVIPGQADFLGNLYAFGAMLSFTIAHAAVIRLRTSRPDVKRPYKGPGNLRVFGHDLPMFAVVGGIGTLFAFVTVTALHVDVALAGVGWLLTGVLVFVVFRKSQGLDLTTTVTAHVETPVLPFEAEYESVLVALEGKDFDPDLLSTAKALAGESNGAIHVLVTIAVPAESPIDAQLPQQEARALAVIEEAKVSGGRRVTGDWVKV